MSGLAVCVRHVLGATRALRCADNHPKENYVAHSVTASAGQSSVIIGTGKLPRARHPDVDARAIELNGSAKGETRREVSRRFGYDLDRRVDEIQPSYGFDASCQGSVPEALFFFSHFFDALPYSA